MENLKEKELIEEILEKENGKTVAFILDKYKKEIFKIIPELQAEDGFDQKNPWHEYDVWNHTLKAIEKTKPDIDIRLTLLLHDIGKPYCFQDDGNVRHFKGHAQKSAEMAINILERLGIEENRVQDIIYLIKNHSDTIDVNKIDKSNIEITKKLLYVQFCDASAYSSKYVRSTFTKLSEIGKKLIIKQEKLNKEEQR